MQTTMTRLTKADFVVKIILFTLELKIQVDMSLTCRYASAEFFKRKILIGYSKVDELDQAQPGPTQPRRNQLHIGKIGKL